MQISNLLTYLKELTLQKFTGIIIINVNQGGIRALELKRRISKDTFKREIIK